MYQPTHGSMSMNKEEQPLRQIHPNTSIQKVNGKVNENESKLTTNGNEASPDSIYVMDDGANSNSIDDDDETQVKYLYSLLKNRLPNSI